DVLAEMDKTVELSSNNKGLTLALAINYGSRMEILDAVKKIVAELADPEVRAEAMRRAGVESLDDLITEDYFASKLYDSPAPDPDLLIRTGGEMRISNYLLWQLSYAELWITDVLWPDFTEETLREGIRVFQRRKRRFGGLNK
ncbi:MAG: di-trans,poly-cis-decaprenylcistransferase, partial [Thermoguttaceae bacterium]|nr:di-trans,poly-cis-decaprenylcistransferase [Thermoguttaceae bacterium]